MYILDSYDGFSCKNSGYCQTFHEDLNFAHTTRPTSFQPPLISHKILQLSSSVNRILNSKGTMSLLWLMDERHRQIDRPRKVAQVAIAIVDITFSILAIFHIRNFSLIFDQLTKCQAERYGRYPISDVRNLGNRHVSLWRQSCYFLSPRGGGGFACSKQRPRGRGGGGGRVVDITGFTVIKAIIYS